MPSKRPVQRLNDILINAERIRTYLEGLNAESFARDQLTRDAVERCLERISEAARKLGDSLDSAYPDVEFERLRRLGSVLRHDYDVVDANQLWQTIAGRLPALEAACRRELAKSKSKGR